MAKPHRRINATGGRPRQLEQRQGVGKPIGGRELQALRERLDATDAAMREVCDALDDATRETLLTIEAMDARAAREQSRPVTESHAKGAEPDKTSREEGS